MKIGCIGLGIMGSRMAANLQKHGHVLLLFNRTRAKAEPLLGPRGTMADSPAQVAKEVDVLLTMLAHPDAVEQAAQGRDGFRGSRADARRLYGTATDQASGRVRNVSWPKLRSP